MIQQEDVFLFVRKEEEETYGACLARRSQTRCGARANRLWTQAVWRGCLRASEILGVAHEAGETSPDVWWRIWEWRAGATDQRECLSRASDRRRWRLVRSNPSNVAAWCPSAHGCCTGGGYRVA